MKFLDLFAGIGGIRLGLERAGHTPVGYVELDKFARQSYQAMHDTTGEWTATDITKVTDEEWSQFNGTVELIAGGFPCQAFSTAGKRKGFMDETRGTLFFEIARAIKQIKPQFILLENVKGLLNHDSGNTFRTILNTLDELGYDVEWSVLNSKDFGVPQNRERVYIVGHSRDGCGREVLPIFGEDRTANSATITDLTPSDHPRHGKRGNVLGVDGISSALTATDYKLPKQVLINPAKIKQIGNLQETKSFGGNPQVGRVYSEDGISPTLNTMQGGGREPKVLVRAVLSPDRENKRQNGRRFKEEGEPAFTLTTQDRHGVLLNAMQGGGLYTNDSIDHFRGVMPGLSRTLKANNHDAGVFDGMRIRKLTPRECWRLQAFPDELFDRAQATGMSDSQLYKQAGNSVTVNVIEYIGNLIGE